MSQQPRTTPRLRSGQANHESRVTNHGFTLVELIIVVIVIGILAAVGMPQYTKAIEKARGAEASAGIQNIQQGEKLYFASNEKYFKPADGGGKLVSTEDSTLDINLPRKGWDFYLTDFSAASGTIYTAYRVQAKRKSGACVDKTITYDQQGNLVDDGASTSDGKSAWDECQEKL